MNTCNIIKMKIFDDGMVCLIVKCNMCGSVNYHTITHATTREEKCNRQRLTIDFNKLGYRGCDNMKCFDDYPLYKPI